MYLPAFKFRKTTRPQEQNSRTCTQRILQEIDFVSITLFYAFSIL